MKRREPLADLAAIVRSINEASQERTRVNGLLDVLSGSEIFESIVAFGRAEPSKAFVPLEVRGDREIAGGWKAWPLNRLFETMALRRISHPHSARAALAIPLDYRDECRIVLAVLSSWAHGEALRAFFEALENFVVPRKHRADGLPEGIPMSPIEPRVACFALCPSLATAIEGMLARRGWRAGSARSVFEMRAWLASTGADVIFLDFTHEADPFSDVLRLHAILPSGSKLVAFGAETYRDLVRQGLLDALIAHDATEPEIFAVLKRFSRQIPELRRGRLSAVSAGFEAALRTMRTPAELSAAGARHAANIMSGWAAMHIVNAGGITYSSEHPRLQQPALTGLPKSFLSDEPLFQLQADERFYREISDDGDVAGTLAPLHPVSAASVPLRHGDRRIGTLVTVSRGVTVDSTAFLALDGLAKIVTRRFEEVEAAADQSVQQCGAWEYVRHGALEFAAYRSRSSRVAWDYLALNSRLGLLVVGGTIGSSGLSRFLAPAEPLEDQLARFLEKSGSQSRTFLAACNPNALTVTYAATGFPVPLAFDASGPVGAVSRRGSVVRGSVAIAPPAGLLIWDTSLRRWLARENVGAASITETLEDLRPPGLAIVVTAASS